MPHCPAGRGSIPPPIVASPSERILLNSSRLSESDIALRISGLSNGGFSRLTIKLELTPEAFSTHVAVGACDFMSFISGTVTSDG